MLTAEEQGIKLKPGFPGRCFYAVDLDGTLAYYDRWRGREHIGPPIKAMVDLVKSWLDAGHVVIIFTSRVANNPPRAVYDAIHKWCEEHLGERLYITAVKQPWFHRVYDDRAVQVIANTGQIVMEATSD